MNIQEVRRSLLRRLSRTWFHVTETRLQRSRHLPRSEIHRILVCRPNHRLGNLLLLTPLLIELERALPEAEVDIVLAGEHGAELFCSFPNVRHIHVLSRRMVRHPFATARILMRIRRARYDLAIDPCEASQSGRFLMAVSGATYMLGIPRQWNAESTGMVAVRPAPLHMAKGPVFLLRRALADDDAGALDRDFPNLSLQLSQEQRRQARELLDGLLQIDDALSTRITIGVFADATGAKRYDEDWWERFVAEIRLLHPAWAMVEIAPPNGRSRLSSRLPVYSSVNPREVAAVISNMACFVSADCGVMHLASAGGAPTVGLFSVTDIAKYGPYGPQDRPVDTRGTSPEAVARLASEVAQGMGAPGAGSSTLSMASGARA